MKLRPSRGLVLAVFLSWTFHATGQTFNSTSNGSDGALSYTTPGTVVFDPKASNPPLDPDGDGIFHFTTITIGAGVTVRLRGDVYNAPVVWLAQGAVLINGTIDASGQNGFTATSAGTRSLSVPGSGGYAGGYSGFSGSPPGAGLGPAGGGRCSVNSSYGQGGGFTGSQFLVPLIGGSGGGGATGTNDNGGAGGGAILIASSVSLSGAGSISVRGGNFSGNSGGGAGGAIRLVAPSVTISGALITTGSFIAGCGPGSGSANGVVRVEAFDAATTAYNVPSGSLYKATPHGLYLTSFAIPTLRVLSVGGLPVTTSPTGTFSVPDVTVNSSSPLPVAIEASNVPVGTIVTLTIFTENAPDQIIQSTPLAGSVALSTASASVTLPTGFSRGFLRATFTQP